MNKRPIDKTKKSNRKCEHCAFWLRCGADFKCDNPESPKHNQMRHYYHQCRAFNWKE